jgi:hypothetical protein
MKKIAILGCENSHANAFLKFITGKEEFSDIECIGVYSNDPAASEKLVKHEEEGKFEGTAFDVGTASLYEQLYYKITEGRPMTVTPEMAAAVIGVIETVHAQNPLPLKF